MIENTLENPIYDILAIDDNGTITVQLDAEIQSNGWLVAPADPDIVFDRDNGTKWLRAMHAIGVDPAVLSSTAGHA